MVNLIIMSLHILLHSAIFEHNYVYVSLLFY